MSKVELVDFFVDSHNELLHLKPNPKQIEKWKMGLLKKLEKNSKFKIQNMNLIEASSSYIDPWINEHEFKVAEVVIRDMIFKYSHGKSKEEVEAIKLLQAREENSDFELKLAEMICGDNEKFPYRSSSRLTDFFQKLGYDFTHDGSTRKYWVTDRLKELTIKEIHELISKGLFKKKYFLDYVDSKKDELEFNSFFKEAANEFKTFIHESSTAEELFDLSSVLDMNVNLELLFDTTARTDDKELNNLIEEAKERFLNPKDKQVALEKLWDAFERIKTHFNHEGLNKGKSAAKLVTIISEEFDKEFVNEEFKKLTSIGNDYRIRHHETDKKELTHEHINYFFFRMLALIDLCLHFLNSDESEELYLY